MSHSGVNSSTANELRGRITLPEWTPPLAQALPPADTLYESSSNLHSEDCWDNLLNNIDHFAVDPHFAADVAVTSWESPLDITLAPLFPLTFDTDASPSFDIPVSDLDCAPSMLSKTGQQHRTGAFARHFASSSSFIVPLVGNDASTLQTPSESPGNTAPSLHPDKPAKRSHSFVDQPSPTEDERLSKRHKNNIAAKKYRQKKIDRIKELEDQVADITSERDELRIKLARQEAETAALREMLKLNS